MIGKRWIVGQDHTELVDAAGKVIDTQPRWSLIEQNAVMLAMRRADPRCVRDKVHQADIQPYSPAEERVRKIGRTLALVNRRA